ncbi:ScyD/ScyE family protein [Nocardioides sp. GCM10027113]|uniref:ScyD/ScyE family protein n=1 Tax=unclassified Nocardioides TaxID=2615069 RepID=UPI003618185E
MVRSSRPVLATVALATAAFLAGTLAPSAAAPSAAGRSAPPDTFRQVAGGLDAPLSLAVSGNDSLWVAQSFAGNLTRQRPGREPRVVWQGKRVSTAGVSVRRKKVVFTTAGRDALLWRFVRRGHARQIADIGRFERNHNPDSGTAYGLPDLDAECAAQWPVEMAGPHTYTGIVESNPYATEMTGHGIYVADAAGNAILHVARGNVSLVSVLPTIPIVITAEVAEEFGLPACVVGETYHFEPVPTDVEMGRDGMLYVTSLPGGPEGLGANGSVFRIDPSTGVAERLVTGLVTATGLDLNREGDIYVAQLFAGEIVRIPAGTTTPERYKQVTLPADVEWRAGRIFATTMTLAGPGAGAVESWAD